MENEIISSSFKDIKTLRRTSAKNDTKIIEAITVKSELVDIKKEPDSNNYTECVLDICNIEQDSIDHKKFKYCPFEEKSEIWANMQIHKNALEFENEDPTFNDCDKFEVTYHSVSEYDIKRENIEYDRPLEFMKHLDDNVGNENVAKFIEPNSLEFMEQNESLHKNVDLNAENESDFGKLKSEMFGMSEMFNFTSQEIIRCKYCNFETKHKNQLWGHMQIHNDSLNSKSQEVTLYKCPYPQCKFQTIYKYSITKHVNTHKTQKYKCSKCSYVTLQLKKYDQHIKSCEKVPEETLLQCDQCDFKVKTQGLLLVHQRRHKDDSKLLRCPECDLTTMYASALKKHIEKHRREENHLFTCTKCSYKSPSKTMLMRHEKVHGSEEKESEGKYQCSDCSYQTMSLDKLESHMVEHRDEKNGEVGTIEGSSKMYFCPECSFKTSLISKANHHKNLHIRQRNGEIYKCAQCNYETMYKYLLKRHSLKHKDTNSIKTYPCDLCDYRAKLKDYLVRHKRTHMKKQLQQYKCTVCLFETIYKHTFKEHLARHNISLVDVKKFLSDKPDVSDGGSVYVSEEVLELQNVLKHIVPTNSQGNLYPEVT